MPVVLALPVVTAACFFCCRRAMGAACIRHSLRPLMFWRDTLMHRPGAFVPRGGGGVSPRHCEERQRRSNPWCSTWRYGLLRFARNDEKAAV
jgi:hypothetical protein